MSAGVAVRPLDRVPAVEIVAAPELGPQTRPGSRRSAAGWTRTRTMVDGPILMVRPGRA